MLKTCTYSYYISISYSTYACGWSKIEINSYTNLILKKFRSDAKRKLEWIEEAQKFIMNVERLSENDFKQTKQTTDYGVERKSFREF